MKNMQKMIFALAVAMFAFELKADCTHLETKNCSYPQNSDHGPLSRRHSSQNKVKQKESVSCVYIGAYGGYGVTEGMRGVDGQTAQGRFALGVDAYRTDYVQLGIEAAVQSGNTLRLHVNGSTLAAIGGLYPLATVKGFPDFLVTAKGYYKDFFVVLKGGVAYRQFTLLDRFSSKDSIRRGNGEVQVGVGYQMTSHVRLTAFYQGIYSGNSADIRLSPVNDVLLGQIPTQQGGWIGIEYSL
jgi:hypothetical protein